jgi:hypothetical protein
VGHDHFKSANSPEKGYMRTSEEPAGYKTSSTEAGTD